MCVPGIHVFANGAKDGALRIPVTWKPAFRLVRCFAVTGRDDCYELVSPT